MATYTLTVNVDPAQITILKQSGYKLCVAKKLNGVYTVVWTGGNFLAANTFQWNEAFQIFAVQSFKDGALVKAATNIVNIQYGQTATLDQDGVFQQASGTLGGASFTADNEYSPINFAVNAMVNGAWAPTYVDPTPAVTGTETFTPIESLMVWFDRTLTTSTMFTHAVSNTVEVPYQGVTSMTASYNGVWVLGNPTKSYFEAVVPSTYHIKGGFTPMALEFKDGEVAQLLASHAKQNLLLPGVIPPWVVSCLMVFATGAAANLAVAYFSNNILPNLKISIPEVTGTSVTIKLDWSSTVFMKEAMKGSNDVQKIENAFDAVLKILAKPPTSHQYTVLNATE